MSRVAVSRVLLAMLLLVVSACQIDVQVDLDVSADGSGVVTLHTQIDKAARDHVGDIASQLRVADLERGGWSVTTETKDAATDIIATKVVPHAERWQSVLDQLAGPGVFTNVDLSINDDHQRMSLDLDISEGWQLLTDERATDALGGEPFGTPLDSLTNGRAIDEIVSFELHVRVHNFDDNDPTVRTFAPSFEQGGEQVVVEATGENAKAVILGWVGNALFALSALAIILALTGVVLQRRSDRLRPAPTPEKLAARVPETEPSSAPGHTSTVAPAGPASSGHDTVRLVVVEVLAVLYGQPHLLDEGVLRFVRNERGTARADTIADGFANVLTGAISTESFWEVCGVQRQAAGVDDRYIARRKLQSGAAAFLAEMQRRRIPVAATTNDGATWSRQMRDRDRLSAVWPWLVSSEVGATTSNVAMFEVLRRESGVAHTHCLYIDTSLANLDAARELGMKTALLDRGDLTLPDDVGHPIVTDLGDLFDR